MKMIPTPDVTMTHFSQPHSSDQEPQMMRSEDCRVGRRAQEAADELFGPFAPLRSAASPGSGFWETGPK